MYAWDPPSSSKFSTKGYRHCAELLSVLVTLGRRCWLSQREFFFTPKVSNPSRGNDKGDHTAAHHVSNSYDLTDPRVCSSVLPCSDGAVTEEKAA